MIFTETEILDGMRAWTKAQELLAGVPDTQSVPVSVVASWYDTTIDDHQGAFCHVSLDSGLDDWRGKTLRVERAGRPAIFVYCIGRAADLATPFALARRAWFEIGDLAVDEYTLSVQVVS